MKKIWGVVIASIATVAWATFISPNDPFSAFLNIGGASVLAAVWFLLGRRWK